MFEHVLCYGDDESFEPHSDPEPTTTAPGSPERVEELRRRVELAQDLWHRDDVVEKDRLLQEQLALVGSYPEA